MTSNSLATLNSAVVGRRIVAFIIDFVILLVFVSVMAALFGDIGSTEDSDFQVRLDGLPFAFTTLVGFAYFIILEGSSGATLGKRAMNLRVVKSDGFVHPSERQFFDREAAKQIELLLNTSHKATLRA